MNVLWTGTTIKHHDGGSYILRTNRYGLPVLVCDLCGHKRYLEITRKGGSKVPFPKGIPKAADIGKDLSGYPLEDYDGIALLLKGYDFKEVEQYGKRYTLYCENEDGKEVKLATFSAVIAEQLSDLAELLPVLIIPRKVENYYTIY